MFRFLLGFAVGSIATATYLNRQSTSSGRFTEGRVDELTSAQRNVVADPEFNAGDGTSFNRNENFEAPLFEEEVPNRALP